MAQQEQKPLKRCYTFQSAPTRWWEIVITVFQPGPIQYLIHLERLTGMDITGFRYIWAMDDFDATLNYKNHELKLWMAWEGDLVLMSTEDVPCEIFEEVCDHLKNYKWVSGFRVVKFQRRYKKPVKVTWYEK